MTSFRTLVPAALCALLVAGAAAPASAHGFGPSRGGGFHDHHHGGGGLGRALAFGGLGLATGAIVADAYAPRYDGPACGGSVTRHYDAYGRVVKVIREDPC